MILIGSHARGDQNERSDIDVLIVNYDEEEAKYRLRNCASYLDEEKISFVNLDEEEFSDYYDKGSLFLYHVLNEGVLLEGDHSEWESLKLQFNVQRNYSSELEKIMRVLKFYSEDNVFGGKYLFPLVNIFSELKNACIFYLAHQGTYEFGKDKILGLVGSEMEVSGNLKFLKNFYDYSVRELDVELPFDPNDGLCFKSVMNDVNSIVGGMYERIR